MAGNGSAETAVMIHIISFLNLPNHCLLTHCLFGYDMPPDDTDHSNIPTQIENYSSGK